MNDTTFRSTSSVSRIGSLNRCYMMTMSIMIKHRWYNIWMIQHSGRPRQYLGLDHYPPSQCLDTPIYNRSDADSDGEDENKDQRLFRNIQNTMTRVLLIIHVLPPLHLKIKWRMLTSRGFRRTSSTQAGWGRVGSPRRTSPTVSLTCLASVLTLMHRYHIITIVIAITTNIIIITIITTITITILTITITIITITIGRCSSSAATVQEVCLLINGYHSN